jgi:VWFA-related protein
MKILKIPTLALLGVGAFLIPSLDPQELHHTAGVINVEVPVRVFDGDRFVDNLSLNDFEVFEDGKPQKIVTLYLIRKTAVQKEEAAAVPKAEPAPKIEFVPEKFRNFLFIFEVHDPMPKINDALDYFFKEVFHKGDRVTVVSPKGTYQFKQETFDRFKPDEVARQIKNNLRKDILLGAFDYRSLIQDIRDLSNPQMQSDVTGRLISNDIRELRDRLTVNDQGIRRLAQAFKAQDGRKIIFAFYQKEEIVIPGSQYDTSKYEDENWRPIDYNVKDVEKIFADASLTVNFIFLTNSTTTIFDITDQRRAVSESFGGEERSLVDLSHSLYGAFREMAHASGGTTEASANALAAFRKTVTASENYYLLYYVPSQYKADGKFKKIEVTVKGKHYKISNRSGYIAN